MPILDRLPCGQDAHAILPLCVSLAYATWDVYDATMNVKPRTRVRKDYTLDPRTIEDLAKLASTWRCSASAVIDRAIAQAAGEHAPPPHRVAQGGEDVGPPHMPQT